MTGLLLCFNISPTMDPKLWQEEDRRRIRQLEQAEENFDHFYGCEILMKETSASSLHFPDSVLGRSFHILLLYIILCYFIFCAILCPHQGDYELFFPTSNKSRPFHCHTKIFFYIFFHEHCPNSALIYRTNLGAAFSLGSFRMLD